MIYPVLFAFFTPLFHTPPSQLVENHKLLKNETLEQHSQILELQEKVQELKRKLEREQDRSVSMFALMDKENSQYHHPSVISTANSTTATTTKATATTATIGTETVHSVSNSRPFIVNAKNNTPASTPSTKDCGTAMTPAVGREGATFFKYSPGPGTPGALELDNVSVMTMSTASVQSQNSPFVPRSALKQKLLTRTTMKAKAKAKATGIHSTPVQNTPNHFNLDILNAEEQTCKPETVSVASQTTASGTSALQCESCAAIGDAVSGQNNMKLTKSCSDIVSTTSALVQQPSSMSNNEQSDSYSIANHPLPESQQELELLLKVILRSLFAKRCEHESVFSFVWYVSVCL